MNLMRGSEVSKAPLSPFPSHWVSRVQLMIAPPGIAQRPKNVAARARVSTTTVLRTLDRKTQCMSPPNSPKSCG